MTDKSSSFHLIGTFSAAHMLEDFLCAYTVFGFLTTFAEPEFVFLWYNFSAFALQLPFGALIDLWMQKTDRKLLPGMIFGLSGLLLTVLVYLVCLFLHVKSDLAVFLIGLGNCLFHVGGGVISISEDNRSSYRGKGLGVFVAPGAIGLYIGGLISYFYYVRSTAVLILLITAVLCFRSIQLYRNCPDPVLSDRTNTDIPLVPVIVCFLVVVLRSLTGLAVRFPWKTGIPLSVLAVLLLAGGKTAGGFLGASIGYRKTIAVTLAASAVCYFLGNHTVTGLAAIFLFNMTMPVTLYLLARKMPDLPGTAFGILTMALFIGFLPVYFNQINGVSPVKLGTGSALVSLVLLLWITGEYRS